MFGVTLGVFNKFEELYNFANRTKNTMTGVKEKLESEID